MGNTNNRCFRFALRVGIGIDYLMKKLRRYWRQKSWSAEIMGKQSPGDEKCIWEKSVFEVACD